MDDMTQAVVRGLVERCAIATQTFDRLNKEAEPLGMRFDPSPVLPLACMIDSLVEQLVNKGLLDYNQFVITAFSKQADALEEQLAAGATVLREKTGVIVPLGFSGRPQG